MAGLLGVAAIAREAKARTEVYNMIECDDWFAAENVDHVGCWQLFITVSVIIVGCLLLPSSNPQSPPKRLAFPQIISRNSFIPC